MALLFKSKFENRLGTSFINDYFGINLYDFLFEKILKINSEFYTQIDSYSNIKGTESILDIGAGTSSFSIYLKKKYKDLKIEAVDGSPKMLEIAQKKIKKNRLDISTKEGLAENLSYEDETFDIIYAVFLFSYIPETIKPFALKELNRVLKQDGKLIIIDITEQTGLKKVWNSLKYIPNQFFLEEGLSGQYVDLLNKSGFENIIFNPVIDKFIDISIITSKKVILDNHTKKEVEIKKETKKIKTENKPTLLKEPKGKKDDLKLIKGIGKVFEEKLNTLGIYHFSQIASWTEKEIKWIDENLPFPGRVVRENWVEQAKTLQK